MRFCLNKNDVFSQNQHNPNLQITTISSGTQDTRLRPLADMYAAGKHNRPKTWVAARHQRVKKLQPGAQVMFHNIA